MQNGAVEAVLGTGLDENLTGWRITISSVPLNARLGVVGQIEDKAKATLLTKVIQQQRKGLWLLAGQGERQRGCPDTNAVGQVIGLVDSKTQTRSLRPHAEEYGGRAPPLDRVENAGSYLC